MGPRCGAYNEAGNHLKILSSAFVSSRQTAFTRFLKRGGKGTRCDTYGEAGDILNTRMGPGEHVIGIHVTSRDAARFNRFEPDPPMQADRSRQCSINNYKMPPNTCMGPDERVIGTHVTSRDAARELNSLKLPLEEKQKCGRRPGPNFRSPQDSVQGHSKELLKIPQGWSSSLSCSQTPEAQALSASSSYTSTFTIFSNWKSPIQSIPKLTGAVSLPLSSPIRLQFKNSSNKPKPTSKPLPQTHG
ncbi:hypothetical protein IEQ34_015580 [Dendrobium chrysotoxum]|uniref:Uncharacterized protein n=1 Tax=Dendrobium chrysotoxum TaxID=161865 RepID=A0AAV7GIL6_DENCH|nr:hypothetical protein IEQ34_015580 [Dendrobium chrysotoxum]